MRELYKFNIISLTWIRVKRSPFPAYFDAVLSGFCTGPLPSFTPPWAPSDGVSQLHATVTSLHFTSIIHLLRVLLRPGGSRWSAGSLCPKMPACDSRSVPGCLGAALRRLPRRQFGSLTHGHKTVSTPPSSLSSSTLLTTLP